MDGSLNVADFLMGSPCGLCKAFVMSTEPVTFLVYQAGPLSVVGFRGAVLDRLDLGLCQQELASLIADNKCEDLAFDLTNVKLIPSGMLGLLASLRRQNVEIHVYNPSDDVAEVLRITGLDRFMLIHSLSL